MKNDSVVSAARHVATEWGCGDVDAMEDIVGASRAVCLKGAMAQVMLALADARTMAAELEGGGIERLERCLYSALAVMEREVGVDARELGADYWAATWSNPWVMSRVA